MAEDPTLPKTQALENRNYNENEDDNDEEVVKILEMEVKQMAESILQYRQTLPNQLKKTLASLLVAQRPPPPPPVEDAFPSPHPSQMALPGLIAAEATNPGQISSISRCS